jgi:uncharacterized protein YbjT (DUF2867 family)
MGDLQIVLGGSGGVGRAVATRLAQQGNQVRAVNRSGRIKDLPDGTETLAADALKRDDIVAACTGLPLSTIAYTPRKIIVSFGR